MSDSSLSYELDAARYPTLGNEFFTRLRDKYPRAFRRTVLRHDRPEQHQQHQSSVRSTPSDSVWSLWECNGDHDKAVVKEAGGILVPISDVSVDERLKHNCDCYRTVKQNGVELIQTLRSLRSTLLAAYSDSVATVPHLVIDVGDCHSSVGDAVGSSEVPKSSSQNVASHIESVLDVSGDDTGIVGLSCSSPAWYDVTVGTTNSTAGNIVISADDAELQIQSVETNTCYPAGGQSSWAEESLQLAEEVNQWQLVSSDGAKEICSDVSLSVEPSSATANLRFVQLFQWHICVCAYFGNFMVFSYTLFSFIEL